LIVLSMLKTFYMLLNSRNLWLLCLLLPLTVSAQEDITGLWKGTLYHDTTGKTLRYEIGISLEKGKLTGFSHTFFIIDEKPYFGVKRIRVKRKNNTIIIEDDGLLADNYPIRPPKGVHQLSVLELRTDDSLLVMSGSFTTTRTREYHAATGKVYLQRKNDFRQSALVPHLTELGLASEIDFAPPLNRRQDQAAYTIGAEPAPNKPAYAPAMVTGSSRIPDVATPELELPAITKPDNQTITTVTTPVPAAPAPGLSTGKTIPVKINKPSLPANSTASSGTPVPKPTVAQPATTAGVEATPSAVARPVTAVKAATTLPTSTGGAEPVLRPSPPATEPTPTTIVTTPSLAPDNAPAIASNRTIETVQTLFFVQDSLQLTLYDNGEVDGDTVSVYLNGRLLMPHQGLSTRAIKKTIYMLPGADSVQLVMYAESLGSIPPNTGLLVVHDGETIYEVRFSADMKKNAAIVLRRKPR
jgi:hypothetical protein